MSPVQIAVMVVQSAWQLAPLLPQIIQDVEKVLPEGGQGAQKLGMVRDTIEAAFSELEGIEVEFARVWTALQPIITRLVAIYNASGLFRHTTPAAGTA
jgi:hypothetical protein